MVGGTHWNWGDRRFHGEGSLGLLRIRSPWVCLKDGFRVVGGDRERLSEVRTRTSHVSCWGGCSFHTGESRWRFSFRVMWSDLSCESESHLVVSNSLWPHGRPHGLYSPWNSSGQNTGVGSFSILQRIFPTQGSNPGLPPCRWILYQLSHKGSPGILEWVAYPFSSVYLPDPGIELGSPALQADSLPTELSGKPSFTLSFV